MRGSFTRFLILLGILLTGSMQYASAHVTGDVEFSSFYLTSNSIHQTCCSSAQPAEASIRSTALNSLKKLPIEATEIEEEDEVSSTRKYRMGGHFITLILSALVLGLMPSMDGFVSHSKPENDHRSFRPLYLANGVFRI